MNPIKSIKELKNEKKGKGKNGRFEIYI